MEVNLVVEGAKFMVLGMSIVFLFLVLMIFAMNVMSKVIHRYFPEPLPTPAKPAAPAADKLKKVAAIAAAIHHHNKSK
jgi:oxaloacetate decarboxylase gamma subunit